MLQNVSEAGATAEGSAETLIAAIKAFNLDASESTHIVDALNKVDIRALRYRNVSKKINTAQNGETPEKDNTVGKKSL